MRFDFDVYLCHCAADHEDIQGLAKQLESDGLTVWSQPTIKPIESTPQLNASRSFVLCISNRAMKGPWATMLEASLQFRDPLTIERRFIALRLDGAKTPFADHIDWKPRSANTYRRLLQACRNREAPSLGAAWASRVLRSRPCGTPLKLKYSKDGASIAAGYDDEQIVLWQSEAKLPAQVFEGHYDAINTLDWTFTGLLVSGSRDGSCKIWDPAKPTPLYDADNTFGPISGVATHSKYSLVAIAHYDRVSVWNPLEESKTPKEVIRCDSEISSISFNDNDDLLLATTSETFLAVYDSTFKKKSRIKGPEAFTTAAWSPDSSRIAGASADYTIQIYSTSTRTLLHTLDNHNAIITSLVFDPSGRYLASGSLDRTVLIWDTSTGRQVSQLRPQNGGVNSIDWHPSKDVIAVACKGGNIEQWNPFHGVRENTFFTESLPPDIISWDLSNSRLFLKDSIRPIQSIDLTDGSITFLPQATKYVTEMFFDQSSDKLLATANSGQLYQLNLFSSPNPLTSVGHEMGEMQILGTIDDGLTLVLAEDEVVLLDQLKQSSRKLFSINGGRPVLSPNKLLLAVCAEDSVFIYSIANREIQSAFDEHGDTVSTIAWREDSALVASGSNDLTIMIWSADDGRALFALEGNDSSITCLAWSSDGRYLASGSHGAVMVWRLSDRQILLFFIPLIPRAYCENGKSLFLMS
jgi:WD40 repeat protein